MPEWVTGREVFQIEDYGLYTARIGAFTISGPHMKNFACTMGIPCVLDLPGVALSLSNGIAVISAGVCGRSNSRVENTFVGMPNPIFVDQDPYSYEPGVPIDGKPTADGYTVCWGHAPELKWDYSLTVGFMALNGPGRGGILTSNSANLKCYRTLSCTIEFKGIGLETFNGVMFRYHPEDGYADCGADDNGEGVVVGMEHNPAPSEQAYVGQYRHGQMAPNFECPEEQAKCHLLVCWAHDARGSDHAAFDSDGRIVPTLDHRVYNVLIGFVRVLPAPR
jgi:hypothetical protein